MTKTRSRLPIAATLLSIGLMLAGCTSYWTKTGASDASFAEAKGDCLQRAYGDVPAAMTRGAVFDAPYDANTDARNAAVTRCLDGKGWTLVQRGPD